MSITYNQTPNNVGNILLTIPVLVQTSSISFSGGYKYQPAYGFYCMEAIDFSPLEGHIIFVVTNTMVMLPFLATITLCILVLVKLSRRSLAGRNTTLTTASKRITTAAGAEGASSQQAEPNPDNIKMDALNSSVKMCSFTVNLNAVAEECNSDQCNNSSHESRNKSPVLSRSFAMKRRKFFSKLRLLKVNRSCKSTSLVMMMIVFYIACLLPANLLNLYNMLLALQVLPVDLVIINQSNEALTFYLYCSLTFNIILYTLHSSCNPFIYYFRSHPVFTNKCLKAFISFKNRRFLYSPNRGEKD